MTTPHLTKKGTSTMPSTVVYHVCDTCAPAITLTGPDASCGEIGT